MAVVSPPYSLGAPTVVHAARLDRLALGSMFLPGAGVRVRTGMLHGPAGSLGAVVAAADSVTVDPFRAVIQSGHGDGEGSYIVPNDAAAQIAMPTRNALNPRRALLAVWVADSEAADVASSAETDGAWLGFIVGDPAAAPVLPADPVNGIVLGEVLVPSTANGGPIVYTPRTVPVTALRGQPLPVANAAARTALGSVFSGLDVIQLDTGRRWYHSGAGWQQLTVAADLPTAPVRYFASQAARVAASGDFDGQLAVEVDNDRVLRWTGSAWRYVGDHLVVANAAARDALTSYAGLEVRLADTGVAYYYTGSAWATLIPPAGDAPRYAYRTTVLAVTDGVPFCPIAGVEPGTYIIECVGHITGTSGTLRLYSSGGAATGNINTFSVAPGTSNNAFVGNEAQALNAVSGGATIGRGPFRMDGVVTVTATTTLNPNLNTSYTMQVHPGTFTRLTKVA